LNAKIEKDFDTLKMMREILPKISKVTKNMNLKNWRNIWTNDWRKTRL